MRSLLVGTNEPVTHTFLLEAGRWLLKGHQWSLDGEPVPFSGQALVKRAADDWFHAIMRMGFAEDTNRPPLLLEYRGRLSDDGPNYTYVLQHGQLGRIEGEGLVTPATLLHRYWLLGSKKQSGFESFFQVDGDRYCYTSGLMEGLRIITSLEATLERV